MTEHSRSQTSRSISHGRKWAAGFAGAAATGGLVALGGGAWAKLTDSSPNAAIYLLAVGLAAPVAILGLLHATTKPSMSRRGWALLLAVAAWPIVSTAWSVDAIVTLRRSLILVVTVGVALWLSQAGPERIRAFAGGYLLTAVALPLLALVGGDASSLFEPTFGFQRATLAFANSNEMARNVLLAVVAVVALNPTPATAATGGRSRQRAGLAFVLIWLTVIVLYRFTRSTQVLAVATVGFLAVLYRPYVIPRPRARSRVRTPRRQLRSLIALASLPLLYYSGQRVLSSATDLTITGRTDVWAMALEAIRAKPLLGWGYDVFWEHIPSELVLLLPLDRLGSVPAQAHSGFVELLISFGFLFGIILALVLAASTWNALRYGSAGEWLVLWISIAYAVTASTILRSWSLAWILPLAILFSRESRPCGAVQEAVGSSQHALGRATAVGDLLLD